MYVHTTSKIPALVLMLEKENLPYTQHHCLHLSLIFQTLHFTLFEIPTELVQQIKMYLNRTSGIPNFKMYWNHSLPELNIQFKPSVM